MRKVLLATLLVALLGAGCQRQSTDTGGKSPSPSPSPSPAASPTGADLVSQAAVLEGKWTGQWKNLTFGSSGSATADISIDRTAKTITLVLDLGGNVFGEQDPPAQTFTGSLAGDGKFSGNTPTMGNFTAQVAVDQKTFTFEAPDVPSQRVNSVKGSGKLEGTTITADADIVLSDGSTAKSQITLNKTT